MDARLARKKYLGRKKRRRFRRYWAKALQDNSIALRNYARRLCNGDDTKAQDLSQLVSARILGYLPKPNSIKSTKHYLLSTLHNCWKNSKPRAEEVSLDDVMGQVVQLPTLAVEFRIQANLELEEIVERVLREMAAIHPELGIILKMRLEDYAFEEIDAYLGKDPGFSQFVWRRFVNRARRRLAPPRAGKKKPAA